ncbi:hypothetical protein ADUPG1_004753, partial [Aduncisulcus paluster]
MDRQSLSARMPLKKRRESLQPSPRGESARDRQRRRISGLHEDSPKSDRKHRLSITKKELILQKEEAHEKGPPKLSQSESDFRMKGMNSKGSMHFFLGSSHSSSGDDVGAKNHMDNTM